MSALGRGSIEQRVRLTTGLILFSFALVHFLNHALGLYSLEAMQKAEDWRLVVTRSSIGGIILCAAALTHMSLGLRKLAFRSTLKMPTWEATQIILGLSVPFMLLPHLVPMRFAYEWFGTNTSYTTTLLSHWQARPIQQTILLLIVWTHGCMGLHYWLRLSGWYKRAFLPIFALAVVIPLAGLAGFMVQGRALEAKSTASSSGSGGYGYGGSGSSSYGSGDNSSSGYGSGGYSSEGYGSGDYGSSGYGNDNGQKQSATLAKWKDTLIYIFTGLLALTALTFIGRRLAKRASARIPVKYANGPLVHGIPGATLLETSRMNKIAHASVCGGRGRCSTCRVRIDEGAENLSPRNAVERRTLGSINADPRDRLACQVRLANELSVIRVVPPTVNGLESYDADSTAAVGDERNLAVLFLDVRNFTDMSAGKLPYDVVFVLNQLFAATGTAIEANGGWIDKYTGDGLLAVFGRDGTAETGCKQAINAARAIDLALDELNDTLATQLDSKLRLGMGIHVGPLVIGRIGHAASASLTVIGRTVNTAARLEALTKEKNCQLIMSTDVARCAGLSIDQHTISQEPIRGLPEPLDVICVSEARELR